jgi:hypothetical protein
MIFLRPQVIYRDGTSKPSERFIYHTMGFNIEKTLRSAHTVYLCVLCGSENKQRLFPYTALTDWFV